MSAQVLEPPKSDASELSRLVDQPDRPVHTAPTVTTTPRFYGPTVSISHSTLIFCSIILANLTCIALICVCLWVFSQLSDLPLWHKRFFNTLFLVLSTGLAFGIGFLMDRFGLVIRGTLLQKGAYSKKDIGYILRGTLSAYSLLLLNNIKTRKSGVCFKAVFLFVSCAIMGRFGIAFLGFAFNFDETVVPRGGWSRPDWLNMTVLDGSRTLSNSAQPPEMPLKDIRDIASGLFEQSLPWRQNAFTDPGLIEDDAKMVSNISLFAKNYENTHMEVNGQEIIFKYDFQDIRNTKPESAKWEAVIASVCQNQDHALDNTSDTKAYLTFRQQRENSTHVELKEFPLEPPFKKEDMYSWAWGTTVVYQRDAYEYGYTLTPQSDFNVHPGHGIRNRSTLSLSRNVWLTGLSTIEADVPKDFVGGLHSFFNCSITIWPRPTEIQSTPIDAYPKPESDFEDAGLVPEILPEWTSILSPQGLVEMLATFFEVRFHDVLERSDPSRVNKTFLRGTGLKDDIEFDSAYIRVLANEPYWFHYGVSRENRTESELWLAAYLGTRVINHLVFLNNKLQQIDFEAAGSGLQTTLIVKWIRVIGILSALVAFQVVSALGVLWYCKDNLEIDDDVEALSSLLASLGLDFSTAAEGKDNRKREIGHGTFIQEGENYRCDFKKEQ